MKGKLPRFVFPMIIMLIILLPCIWLFGTAFKTWFVFTDSRIEKVEQVFDFTLPENAVPVRYKERLMGQNTVIQELYITGISDIEDFLGNIHGSVKLSADMNSADDETRTQYKTEWWYDKTQRQTVYICVYESGYYYTKAYFFKTENGYDLKLIR